MCRSEDTRHWRTPEDRAARIKSMFSALAFAATMTPTSLALVFAALRATLRFLYALDVANTAAAAGVRSAGAVLAAVVDGAGVERGEGHWCLADIDPATRSMVEALTRAVTGCTPVECADAVSDAGVYDPAFLRACRNDVRAVIRELRAEHQTATRGARPVVVKLPSLAAAAGAWQWRPL